MRDRIEALIRLLEAKIKHYDNMQNGKGFHLASNEMKSSIKVMKSTNVAIVATLKQILAETKHPVRRCMACDHQVRTAEEHHKDCSWHGKESFFRSEQEEADQVEELESVMRLTDKINA